jgi:hypothetical protein
MLCEGARAHSNEHSSHQHSSPSRAWQYQNNHLYMLRKVLTCQNYLNHSRISQATPWPHVLSAFLPHQSSLFCMQSTKASFHHNHQPWLPSSARAPQHPSNPCGTRDLVLQWPPSSSRSSGAGGEQCPRGVGPGWGPSLWLYLAAAALGLWPLDADGPWWNS